MVAFAIPLLISGASIAVGAYWEAKNQIEDTKLAAQAPQLGLNVTQIAYYAALGLGVYWLAKKSGAIK